MQFIIKLPAKIMFLYLTKNNTAKFHGNNQHDQTNVSHFLTTLWNELIKYFVQV